MIDEEVFEYRILCKQRRNIFNRELDQWSGWSEWSDWEIFRGGNKMTNDPYPTIGGVKQAINRAWMGHENWKIERQWRVQKRPVGIGWQDSDGIL